MAPCGNMGFNNAYTGPSMLCKIMAAVDAPAFTMLIMFEYYASELLKLTTVVRPTPHFQQFNSPPLDDTFVSCALLTASYDSA